MMIFKIKNCKGQIVEVDTREGWAVGPELQKQQQPIPYCFVESMYCSIKASVRNFCPIYTENMGVGFVRPHPTNPNLCFTIRSARELQNLQCDFRAIQLILKDLNPDFVVVETNAAFEDSLKKPGLIKYNL